MGINDVSEVYTFKCGAFASENEEVTFDPPASCEGTFDNDHKICCADSASDCCKANVGIIILIIIVLLLICSGSIIGCCACCPLYEKLCCAPRKTGSVEEEEEEEEEEEQ